ncbi:hypothetical protein OKW21_003921 [Catalinimonas alkaloidigena]|nr:hypothetical protein [Catalinimonas alkaloidigena]
MEKKYLSLNDLEAYQIAYHLSNKVWKIVLRWDNFSRNTLGQQFVRVIDSVSAYIAEGSGRFGKKTKFVSTAMQPVLITNAWTGIRKPKKESC